MSEPTSNKMSKNKRDQDEGVSGSDLSSSEVAPQSPDDDVFAQLSPDQEARITQRILMQAEQYSSPHPHPDHLERYAALYPDAPKIVFDQFRDQGNHRREMESKYMAGSERRANIGQWLAFVLVLAAIIGGFLAILHGNAVAGSTIMTVAFGGGVVLAVAGVGGPRKTAVKGSPTRRNKAGVGEESIEQSSKATTGSPDEKGPSSSTPR